MKSSSGSRMKNFNAIKRVQKQEKQESLGPKCLFNYTGYGSTGQSTQLGYEATERSCGKLCATYVTGAKREREGRADGVVRGRFTQNVGSKIPWEIFPREIKCVCGCVCVYESDAVT